MLGICYSIMTTNRKIYKLHAIIIYMEKKYTSKQIGEIEKTIEEFRDCLVAYVDPFQNIDKYNKSREQIEELKIKLEKIAKRDSFKEKTRNYQEQALNILGYSLTAFYIFRNSESSRGLNISSEFAKLLEVPNVSYIDTVLENTPRQYRQREFQDQIQEKILSDNEKKFLLKKYNLYFNLANQQANSRKELDYQKSKPRGLLSKLIKKIKIPKNY